MHYLDPRNEILTDNGGKFINHLIREMLNYLKIFIKSSAAESPWSNDITERHIDILGNTINKLLLDKSNDYAVEVIAVWAMSAKNVLYNLYGYSPKQLVFPKNPNYLSVLTEHPPVLEEQTTSELIANYLNEMHAARSAYIESEVN